MLSHWISARWAPGALGWTDSIGRETSYWLTQISDARSSTVGDNMFGPTITPLCLFVSPISRNLISGRDFCAVQQNNQELPKVSFVFLFLFNVRPHLALVAP
jgi:hypothetical protein